MHHRLKSRRLSSRRYRPHASPRPRPCIVSMHLHPQHRNNIVQAIHPQHRHDIVQAIHSHHRHTATASHRHRDRREADTISTPLPLSRRCTAHTRARAHRAAGARRIHQTGSSPPVRCVTPVSATASPTARQGRAARATPLPQPPRMRPSHEQRPRTRQYRCRRVALEESSGAIHRIAIAPHQSSGETWMTIVSGHVSPSVVKRTSCEHSIPCVEQ